MYNGTVSSNVASKNTTPPPRIYVASLRDYNAGRYHGVWLAVTSDVHELTKGVQRMLNRSVEEDAEEWAIHDYEGFGNTRVPENARLETVIRVAASIRSRGKIAT